MKKSVGIAVGLVVAVGAASTAGAWYTGNQLEQLLNTSIIEANQELKLLLPGTGITPSIELIALERGFFTSTARYRVKAPGALDGADAGDTAVETELLFVDHIEHGPFPLSRVLGLKLLPVMAKSNFELENNPTVENWFVASKGLSPLTGDTSIGYNRDVSGSVHLQPLDYSEERGSVKFSGLTLDLAISDDKRSVKVGGNMDSLMFSAPDSTRIEFSDLNLVSDSERGESGLYLGSSESSLKLIQVQLPEQEPLLIKDMLQKSQLDEGKDGVFGSFTYDVGMVSYAGKDVGALKLGGSMKNLDTASLKSLTDLYKELLSQLDAASYDEGQPNFNLTPEQETQLKADIGTLLAGKPVLALDTFAFKTAHGESRFNFALGLNKPTSFELPPQELLMQAIGSLDARLVVSKPMIKDVILNKAALDPSADPAMVAQEAEQMAEMAGMMAVGTQMATVDGNDIVASVKYAEGQVDLNGRKMPVEEFAGMVMGMAGGMGGAPTGDADLSDLEGLDVPDAEAEAEAEADAAVE
ncbi:MAG TPA: YdgA family protein [Pseudomonas sp.]|nr:YdgA family protein [Pseudomonas sp.]